jgi:hypothetical protein
MAGYANFEVVELDIYIRLHRLGRTGMSIRQRRYGFGAAIAAALFLVGCGGEGATGGGLSAPPAHVPPNPAPAPSTKAEGAYFGSTSRGFDLSLLVLENDVAWGLYERNGLLVGFFQGAGLSNQGSFTAADSRDYNFIDKLTGIGSITATWFTDVSIRGTFIPSVGSQYSFTGTAATAASGYDYHRPARLAEVQGAWQGFYGDGIETGTLDVSPAGTVSGVTSLGCDYTGTLAPRASGKNVYDVSLIFGGPPCRLAGQSTAGVAIIMETATGMRRLLVAATDASRDLGVTFSGMR